MADPTPAAPDAVTVTLTRAECYAINQFMSYGATRGNHSWTKEGGEGTGPSPGPLTGCINDMCEANRKVMEALRAALSPKAPA